MEIWDGELCVMIWSIQLGRRKRVCVGVLGGGVYCGKWVGNASKSNIFVSTNGERHQ